MRVIGLTGRIGTGKSTVGRWLADRGAVTIDADSLVHELYATDSELQTALQARFGEHVVTDGHVDRAALRSVFGDPVALRDLEALVHPAVHRLRDRRIAEARATGAPACLVEAIRLVESGGSASCDELWIVTAPEAVQIERLAGRGLDEAEVRRRLAVQGSVADWCLRFLEESGRLGRGRPVIVFDNGGSVEQGRAQAARLWDGVLAGEGDRAPGA